MGKAVVRRKASKLKRWFIALLEKHLSGESIDYRQVIGITVPILVDQLFIIVMSILNTAMISSAGVAAVSAVNMVDSLNFFLIQVFIAIATGGTVIVAQYKGQGNRKMISRTTAQAISAAAIFSLVTSLVVIVFNEQTLNFLFGNAERDVMQNAQLYLIGSCLSFPFFAIYQGIVGALRGVGDTKPVLWLSVLLNLTNTIGNIIFITGFKLGVTGLVISVLISRSIGMLVALLYLIKVNETIHFKLKNTFKLKFDIQKRIMLIGIPFATEQLFFNGGKLLVQTFVVQLGTLALTTNAIASSLIRLLEAGPIALSIAIVTVVGQSIGRRNIKDARKFMRSFSILASLFFIVSAIILLPAYPLVIQMFNAPNEIIMDIFVLLVITAIGGPLFWPQSFVIPGGLRAAGDAKFTTITALLTMWLLRVVLGYVLGLTLGFGIIGVWLAMVIEWAVRGSIFYIRSKGQKWYQHQLI